MNSQALKVTFVAMNHLAFAYFVKPLKVVREEMSLCIFEKFIGTCGILVLPS